MEKPEWQVSVSDTADRIYFDKWNDAVKEARRLSKLQEEPVAIDYHDSEELADFYYTVTNGKLVKHN